MNTMDMVDALRIRIDQAEIGMVVASDVYNLNNQLILTKGTVLDERMITKLRFYHVYGLYVFKRTSEGIHGEENKEGSYIEAVRNTEEFKKFNNSYVETVGNVESHFNKVLQESSEINVDQLLEETDRILKEGRNGIHVFEMLQGIRDYDDLTYVHSLNVSLICNIFGHWLNFSEEDIRALTLAGLFHDIGKMLVPKDIIIKDSKLTKEEYEIVKTHSMKGFQILKDHPIDIRVKYAALMHHERCDGSGYPNGFRSNQIEPFAKIVAIADVYDAMTSNRRYRNAICPFDVVESFEKDGFLKFDPKYIMVFLERIVQSYIHNKVRLNDGSEGEVVMINKLALSRPVIRVGNKFVDLTKEHGLSIEAII
ncbi:MAG TPA: HD-GYP domain-containing protein [Clostridiales bacterium]|nr:HD-GYP domain-containing protein [Clostridiales bacterium]